MNITSRLKQWAEEGAMLGVAIVALALLKYESLIRKRNERR
jgi:hypothetical protein